MSEFNQDYFDKKFDELQVFFKEQLDEQRKFYEEKLTKTPSKKTPVKTKTPVKKIAQSKAYDNWVEGFSNPEKFRLTCHYIAKCGKDAGLACNCAASYMLVGEPTKRSFKLISKENPLQDIIDEFGPDPKDSFAYIRCNTHKKVCTSDNISKAVEFVGTLDNGAIVHADETAPTDEAIAASLSAKPMSPEPESKLLKPADLQVEKPTESETILPVVEETSDNNNSELEDLLENLDSNFN